MAIKNGFRLFFKDFPGYFEDFSPVKITAKSSDSAGKTFLLVNNSARKSWFFFYFAQNKFFRLSRKIFESVFYFKKCIYTIRRRYSLNFADCFKMLSWIGKLNLSWILNLCKKYLARFMANPIARVRKFLRMQSCITEKG